MEPLGHVDRVLPGHGVHHEQHVVRRELALELAKLFEHRLVDVKPSRGVDDQRGQPLLCRFVPGSVADGKRSGPITPDSRDPELATKRLKLVNSRRAIHVTSNKQRLFSILGF